jgi:uncharacterized protein YbbC (DUF1343 family)/CubicO group peptidase (beta-lactamase class C family)
MKFPKLIRCTVVLCLLVLCPGAPAQNAPKEGGRLAVLDALLEKAVGERQPPGVVVVVGHGGEVVYRKAFGFRSLEPEREAMTVDTVFDVASLTKPLATATAVMRMVELGQVRLNDPVARYLPEFANHGKEQITVRQLMIHYSGLREDLDLSAHWQGREAAFRLAMEEKPVHPPGAHFLYSDINYIVLGFLVERVSGMPLDKYAEAHVFAPLKMEHTGFNPPAARRGKIAATEYDEREVMLRGVVHDPTTRRMGGVAGHAGVFTTADDLARFAQAVLDRKFVLSALTLEKMISPQQPPNATSVRGLGWDIDSSLSSSRGELLPVGSFGHTGFTGSSMWIDPTTDTYLIVLGNGVHPRRGAPLVSLRSRVATAVAAALDLNVSRKEKLRMASITGYNEAAAAARHVAARNGAVRNGIDVLESRGFDALKSKKRIGVVTNHTGVTLDGRRTIDVLARVPGVELAAVFSPEHGISGALDTTAVGDSVDATTGVRVYSVYGDTDAKRRPPVDVLKSLDAVVFDLQDAGARFYTYETTLGYFLEAAAQAGAELIVLDRPNPITGALVQGPVLDVGRESFVGYHSIPVRHGMTLGELAKMFNAERNLNARLTVVPMQGWMRGDWFDATGVRWANPSPNLRSLSQATLYPGVCLIEGANVSVGRGTDTPFEVVGAPWIDARQFAAYLNARQISGVRFVPVTFTPAASKYAGQSVGGVNIVVVDRNALDAPGLGIELASGLRALYPEQFKTDKLIELIGNQATVDALLAGVDPRRIAEEWREGQGDFEARRRKYLLY